MRRPERVELSDGFVRLRPWVSDDVDDLAAAASESAPEVSVWLPWCHPEYSRCEAEQWVELTELMWTEARGFEFVVRAAEDDRFLGSCGLNNIVPEHRMCNLGYWIRSSEAGRGVATAATRLAARFALEEVDLTRVEIVVDVRNAASLRVAAKAGARREGILRDRLVVHGSAHDAVMFSLVARDLERREVGPLARPQS